MGLNSLRPAHELLERDVKARGLILRNAVVHAVHHILLFYLRQKGQVIYQALRIDGHTGWASAMTWARKESGIARTVALDH